MRSRWFKVLRVGDLVCSSVDDYAHWMGRTPEVYVQNIALPDAYCGDCHPAFRQAMFAAGRCLREPGWTPRRESL